MKTIYKYELEITDVQNIFMPAEAHLLYVGEQDGTLMLWAEVDSTAWGEKRKLLIRGTGRPIYAGRDGTEPEYLGTAQMASGLVWHVYDGGGAGVA